MQTGGGKQPPFPHPQHAQPACTCVSARGCPLHVAGGAYGPPPTPCPPSPQPHHHHPPGRCKSHCPRPGQTCLEAGPLPALDLGPRDPCWHVHQVVDVVCQQGLTCREAQPAGGTRLSSQGRLGNQGENSGEQEPAGNKARRGGRHGMGAAVLNPGALSCALLRLRACLLSPGSLGALLPPLSGQGHNILALSRTCEGAPPTHTHNHAHAHLGHCCPCC